MNFNLKKTSKAILFAAVAMVSVSSTAQDRLASMAPIDRKVRAIDSISVMRYLNEEALTNPASALYPSWNNTYTTHYGVEMPAEYKIDLRNFHMPCDSRLVTSHYGYRRSFRRNHYGTDIKVYIGDTIRAAFSGRIRIVAYERKGYGNYVVIRHPNGLETVYGHMSKHLVAENQVVKAGEPIGLGGNTGRSTGSHLHFETRFLGQFIDPEKLFSFEAQDVIADYYVYRSNGASSLLAVRDNIVGGEGAELTDEQIAQAEQKALESQKFQEERREAVRSRIHKVKKGENLYSIARKRGTTVDKLCRINGISSKTTLRPGQILKYS